MDVKILREINTRLRCIRCATKIYGENNRNIYVWDEVNIKTVNRFCRENSISGAGENNNLYDLFRCTF